MPNTIADNLQILVNAKTDIKNAIVTMGGTVGENDGLEDYVNDILTIPTGGGDGIKVVIPNISQSLSADSISMMASTTSLYLCNVINMSNYTSQLASAGAYLEWSAHLDCYFRRNRSNEGTIRCGFYHGSSGTGNPNLSEYYDGTIPKGNTTATISDDLNYQTQINGAGTLKFVCVALAGPGTGDYFTYGSRISLTNISCKLVIPN